MTIDVEQAKGATLPEMAGEWTENDVILYHLALGAGTPPDDRKELRYVYENDLKVLPSLATVAALSGSMMGLTQVPGVDINLAMVLHGEQTLEVDGELPTAAKVKHSGRVVNVYDKGKGALLEVEVQTDDAASGRRLAVNRFGVFARGEGGFGGDPGPKPGNQPPERAPDLEVKIPTLPQQALLYRLTGDRNPLHADPDFAALGGFPRPILHGLCTYGMVLKAVVDHVHDGDVAAIGSYSCRFAGVLYPGETLAVKMWQEDGATILTATAVERDAPVLTNAAVATRVEKAAPTAGVA